jgi:hypothetical protein
MDTRIIAAEVGERREFAYGTTGMVRLMLIGRVFHAEQQRSPNVWKVFARIDGPNAYQEAVDCLGQANIRMAGLIERRRAAREAQAGG